VTPEVRHVHVVFYDGVCGLCNRSVQFLLAIDRNQVLSFAPLQGRTGEGLRQRQDFSGDLETIFFAEHYGTDQERVSIRSTGVGRILARLGGFWGVVSWFRIVPRPIRDFVYRLVARYRYSWFGKFETCRLPSAETKERFLP
jgi:predicted DCC family thiol-disulfide oxidoreductase YuxK